MIYKCFRRVSCVRLYQNRNGSTRRIDMQQEWCTRKAFLSLVISWEGLHRDCSGTAPARPNDRGSKHLWNVGLLQQDYTAPHPRRLSSSFIILMMETVRTSETSVYFNETTRRYTRIPEGCHLHSSSWWWRQYERLKRRSTSTRLYGAVCQKAAIFKNWKFLKSLLVKQY
jgi:hypothetical protein